MALAKCSFLEPTETEGAGRGKIVDSESNTLYSQTLQLSVYTTWTSQFE